MGSSGPILWWKINAIWLFWQYSITFRRSEASKKPENCRDFRRYLSMFRHFLCRFQSYAKFNAFCKHFCSWFWVHKSKTESQLLTSTSTDHHVSLTAQFRMILVSAPPSAIQGTRTSFRLENCWLVAELLQSARLGPKQHPGSLFSDKSLKSYRHAVNKFGNLHNQDKFWHAVKTDASVCISTLQNCTVFHHSLSHRQMTAILSKRTKVR